MALLLCAAAGCSTPQPQKPSLSAVKGRVFLITVGGDLKPARMANVYLMTPGYDGSFAEAAKKDCRELMHVRRVAPQAFLIRGWVEIYQRDLGFHESVLSAGSRWATHADEDGAFSLDKIPPGSYTITAFGQAGVNLGFWESALKLESGQRAEVKLSSPVISCPVL